MLDVLARTILQRDNRVIDLDAENHDRPDEKQKYRDGPAGACCFRGYYGSRKTVKFSPEPIDWARPVLENRRIAAAFIVCACVTRSPTPSARVV